MGVKRLLKRTRRYQRTEFKILLALYEILQEQDSFIRITDRRVYRKAQIRPSVFYLHYRNVGDLLEENHARILRLMEGVLNHQMERRQNLRYFLRALLICISQNHVYFGIEFHSGSRSFEKWLTEEIRPIVTEGWSQYAPKLNDDIYQQYGAEFTSILRLWAEEDFPSDRLNHYLAQLVQITELGTKRYLQLFVKSE